MIQFRHVSKTFRADHCALRDIDLEIADGEMVFFTGASGAGKTTLLKLIFRAELPSEGEILLDGNEIGKLGRQGVARLRRKMGLVFQECKLLPSLTALENVSLAAEAIGVSMKDSRHKALEILRQSGLQGLAHIRPSALSSGEKQRVAVARALVNEPALIVADEPTGNLDAQSAAQIMGLLQKIRERGATVLIATHDLDLVKRYGTRVISLRRGQVEDDRSRVERRSGAR